jgi:hypothetical protein
MDQGYPGLVEFKVVYSMIYPGSLSIDFLATLVSGAQSTYVIIDIDK